MSRAEILNAFSPAKELTDPQRFAGRKSQIVSLTDALRVHGSVLVVYGERGLGKSSTAAQIQLIALGDEELLRSLGTPDLSLPEDETFLTFYVTCTDRVESLDDLLKLILHRLQAVDLVAVTALDAEQLVDRQTRRKISFKIFEQETTRRYESRTSRVRVESLSIEEQLERELALLIEAFNLPILVIIDELDRARGLAGLGQYLKSVSSEFVKFMLVGIAQSLTDLVIDHGSIMRTLCPVQIPLMSRGELADIVDKAMSALASRGTQLSFERDARERLIDIAGGYPWFVHTVGQAALIRAWEAGRTYVTRDDVIVSLRGLTDNRFAQHFNDLYQMAVRDSINREIVLRVFASWPSRDIPTADVYAACRRLGVANPAVYRGHLVSQKYGEALCATGLQERGLVRFRNDMFKRYIELRPSIGAGVDDRVSKETEKW